MSEIICVTNRLLCRDDFLSRMERIAQARPSAVVLREKDLSVNAYTSLAKALKTICSRHGVRLIIHDHVETAKVLGIDAIHLPMEHLRTLSDADRRKFAILGASCHSVAEAAEAERAGCTYIFAGHIFDTLCKKDVPARGIEFLRETVNSVTVPVYAIGGIDSSNIALTLDAGARGVAVMSGFMLGDNPEELIKKVIDNRN